MSFIQKVAGYLSKTDNLPKVYALAVCLVAVIGLCMIPLISYEADQLYPKSVDITSSLSPYDRGGIPFEETAEIVAQYPENSPAIGWVTAYLTPASQWMADNTLYLGTTIAAHPGGILDEILYYTRGFDTIVEASILLCAFAIASFLYRRSRS
ncbi:MAG TPA: EhaF family protein [Methanocorpusculum sp.]|nr:EhaF family protein [Methanocorpusculum sp.]